MTSFDLGRLQGIGNQHLHVVAPADDVDPFAGQLIDDVLDAIAAHAHAGPDGIDPLVGAADRHLAAIAGLAGHGPNLDHTVGDFRNLLLEQSLDQGGPGAAEDDFDAAAGLRTSHTVARTRSLAWCVSPGICSLRGRMASQFGSDTVAAPLRTAARLR